ncbi:MAG: DUF4915 domain-containing protein [Steroidobacteraceae bacterium]
MSQLSAFLNPGEVILISCCNLGSFGSRYSLAALTTEGISWLNLDDAINPSTDIGVTGIAATEKDCFVAVQGKQPRILSLGRDLRVNGQFECKQAQDIHSLAERDGSLYIVSTARNQVVSIDCKGGALFAGEKGQEKIAFAGSITKEDATHLNSICFIDGGAMLVSMFGIKWRADARLGAIFDVSNGTTVHRNIGEPHSLTYLPSGVVTFCESRTSSFCLLEPGSGSLRKVCLSGYTRGSTFTGRHFVVGASCRRVKSRSTASFNEMPASRDPHGNSWQRSSLYFLNPDLSTALHLDFTSYAPEIYDIVFLGNRFTPSELFRDAAARRIDAMHDEIRRTSDYFGLVSHRRASE